MESWKNYGEYLMVQITNQFERALSLLVSQFREQKPDGSLTNLQRLIKVLVTPLQQLEDVKWQLKTERWLSTSVGVQLDEIGEILGLPREIGESDEDYRERLQFQIFINISSGTPEEIMAVLKFLTDATHVNISNIIIADFQLETNGTKFPDPPNLLNEAIFQVSPAGVDYAPIVATYGEPITFQFSNDVSDQMLYVTPVEDDPTSSTSLELEPYNALLYVAAGAVDDIVGDGCFDELDFPLPEAGAFAELIQIGGNFPPGA